MRMRVPVPVVPPLLSTWTPGRAAGEQVAELGDRRLPRRSCAASMVATALPISSLRCSPVAVLTISSSCTGAGVEREVERGRLAGGHVRHCGHRPVADAGAPGPGSCPAPRRGSWYRPPGWWSRCGGAGQDDPGGLERLSGGLIGHRPPMAPCWASAIEAAITVSAHTHRPARSVHRRMPALIAVLLSRDCPAVATRRLG